MRQINPPDNSAARLIFIALSASILSACGGSDPGTSTAPGAATGTVTLSLPGGTGRPVAQVAVPTFHAAAIVLEEPSDVDALEPSASAHLVPHTQQVPVELSRLSTRRLTREVIDGVLLGGDVPAEHDVLTEQARGVTSASANGTLVTSYTPAQMRAAYHLPALPAAGATLTSAQAASLGAGQTIYIIDASDDANAAAELANFSTKFGLPQCGTANVLAPNTVLPLTPASATGGCAFRQVYSTATGGITATNPGYFGGWNLEIALDIEWAHATAPLARIVLIEAPDSSVPSLAAAVKLANAMGPGIVSMSFGAPEGGYTAQFDAVFSAPNMTYLAASGDNGAGVSWPAVSARVIAVSGTSLKYDGVNARTETLWAGTGGGVSAFTALPSYQKNSSVPGMFPASGRIVADVSFNGDPNTGEYMVYYPNKGSTIGNWMPIGGTSLATPQWAGLVAVANAERAAKQLLPMGDAHTALYAVAQSSSTYRADIFDITSGTNGSCAACVTTLGYDAPSGLGTPNASNMLSFLVGNQTGPAPVVTGAAVKATTGIPLTFQASVTDKDALTLSLIGAPSGMSIGTTGLVSWANPLQGTYTFAVQAVDATNGLYSQGTYTLAVTGAQAPVMTAVAATATLGTPFSFTMAATADLNPLTYSVSGAPSGLSISSAGVVSWVAPVVGQYSITVTAKDAKTALSGSGILALTVYSAPAPKVADQTVWQLAGTPFAMGTSNGSPQPPTDTYTMSGAPPGMTIGRTGIINWAKPVVSPYGAYVFTVTLTDSSTGLSGSGVMTVTVEAPGPNFAGYPISGVAGKPIAGFFNLWDFAPGLKVTISGIPAGMTFDPYLANYLNYAWKSPVTGTYRLTITAVDSTGASGTFPVDVVIAAH